MPPSKSLIIYILEDILLNMPQELQQFTKLRESMAIGSSHLNRRTQVLQDRYVKIGEINTRYWVCGDHGTAVILLHGLGASAEVWIHNIFALAEQHRVYAPDMVGFGRSDKPSVSYLPSYLVGFIHEFLAALNIERASFVGLSIGGGLALQYTLRYRDQVEKLVLVDSAGLGRETTILLRLATLPFVGELFGRPSPKKLALCIKRLVYNPALATEDLIKLYCELYSQRDARKAFLKVLRAICTIRGVRTDILHPILANLTTITAPTLIIWGKQDRILPVRHAYLAREKIPDSQLHIFDYCGHIPNFEHPEEFNRLVLAFLSND